MKVASHIFTGPLRKSAVRGLGAYANIFAIESFMDELAYKAGTDPVEFRILHARDSRSTECLKRIKVNWAPYPIWRFDSTPETEVEVIDRIEEAPLGAGEAAQGPAAAAVVNAIFDAVKIRVRNLPVSQQILRQP